MILAAAGSRLIPHPYNFTPMAAIALFGGARFDDRRLALAMPLVAMLLSDLFIGLRSGNPVVYGCFMLTVCIGFWLRRRDSTLRVAGAALGSSILFFVVTNFAVWARGSLYPKNLGGLGASYIAAIPFFQNTILGDLVYTAVLFGGFALAQRRFPVLSSDKPNYHQA
jgi:hypothetical protein